MNHVRAGYRRDSVLVATIGEWKALTTEQVALLLFPIPAGLRKAQQRLKKLYEQKRLLRCQHEASFCYYVDRKPGQLDHVLALNWVRIWLTRRSHWTTLDRWEYEVACGDVRADGIGLVRNKWTNSHEAWFIEYDRGVSHNPWDKAHLYNTLYESGRYLGAWWVPFVTRFPAILCVTDSAAKLNEMQRGVKKHNPHGLRFEMKALEDLIREVRTR